MREKPHVPPTPVDQEAMTITLSVRDRVQFPQLFPQSASYIDHVLEDDITKKVVLSQEEITELGMKEQTGPSGQIIGYVWTREKEKDTEIRFTGAEIEFLRRAAKRLIERKVEINRDLYLLIKKIQDAEAHESDPDVV